MMFKRIFILICLLTCLFAMASVFAGDANDTVIASDDTSLELCENNEINEDKLQSEENPTLEENDKTTNAKSDSEILTDIQYTYTYLKEQIGSGGNITLTKGTYTYNNDGGTIDISTPGIINGNSAVIDMARTDNRAFYISTSGVTIKNLTIKNANSLTDKGGAIFFTKSGIVENCTFINNNAFSNGGAIYFSYYGTYEVRNCNFINNTAEYGGGVYFQQNGTITNSTFTNNTALSMGGAVYLGYGNVTNCIFTHNTAPVGGGAIKILFGNVEKCNFSNNKANISDGGAVDDFFGSNITNCNFVNNSATYGGAVSLSEKGSAKNCKFINNIATNDGGAVYIQLNGTIADCNFIANNAKNYGGAVYFRQNSTMTNCNFIANNAKYRGGAVYFSYNCNISNCNFVNNSATDNCQGGAIFFDGICNVTDCNFTNNKANGYKSTGGAVYLNNAGNITNCKFTNNKAEGYGSCGGAVYLKGGKVTKCKFNDNSARYNDKIYSTSDVSCGGALYSQDYCEITDCNFTNNNAEGYGSCGGAVYFNRGKVTKCKFSDNYALYGGEVVSTGYESCGGALYLRDYSEVTDCKFTNNNATSFSCFGGGICLKNTGKITKCKFSKNNANGYNSGGGAVYFDDAVEAMNCNFADNYASAGGAVFFDNITSGNMINCNFTNNNAGIGSAIFFWKTSTIINVSNSRFLNNRADAHELQVIKNENNITIIFTGENNLINAIYCECDVNFSNVTYWGENGITNTDITAPVRSYNEAGQIINIVAIIDGNKLNTTEVTDANGKIVIDIVANKYAISVRHNADSYYSEAEKIISNMKFNINVTSQTTNNRTVNITAESNIPNEIIKGNLLFNITNTDLINANYAGNGIWWAVHVFDECAPYNVNATYIGWSNVTVNNATITINKLETKLIANSVITTYNSNKKLVITLKGINGKALSGVGLTVRINSDKTYTTDANGQVIINVGKLIPKTYNVQITLKESIDFKASQTAVKIKVKKAKSKITAKKKTFKAKKKVKKYEVTLKSGKKPIKKVKVTLKLKGKTYKATTNAKGMATFKIKKLNKKLKAKATLTYKGNAYYKAVSKKVKITVK